MTQRSIKESSELELVQKSVGRFQIKVQILHLIEEDIKERSKELENKKKQLSFVQGQLRSYCPDIELKDSEFNAIRRSIEEKGERLRSIQSLIMECEKQLSLKEGEFGAIQRKIEESKRVLEKDEEKFNLIKGLIMERDNDLQFKDMKFGTFLENIQKCKEDCQRKEEQIEYIESEDKQSEERVKKLKSEDKQYEGRVKNLESEEKQFEKRVKNLELKEKHFESLIKSFEEEKALKEKTQQLDLIDARSVRNRRNLQMIFNELLEKYDLVSSVVSNALKTSADPAKLVLDEMQGFYPLHSRQVDREYDVNIIRRSCILLLNELQKCSPVINSHVKEEAMKLASEWKANTTTANVHCLEVLGFFKFVAAFKLGSSFDANELQRLPNEVSHCEHAYELGESLGNGKRIPGKLLLFH